MKQLQIYDIDPQCTHQKAYDKLEDTSTSERLVSIFDNVIVSDNKVIKDIIPVKQDKLTLKLGYYIRTVDNRVYKIAYYGVPRSYGDIRTSKRTREGASYTKSTTKQIKTIMVEIPKDGFKVTLYFDETDIFECHENIINCIYTGDTIINTEYRRLKVLAKQKDKSGLFILCTDGTNRYVLHDQDIVRKENPDWIDISKLDVGDTVKHRLFGWCEIVEIWHQKARVKNNQNNIVWVYEWDIVEVQDDD